MGRLTWDVQIERPRAEANVGAGQNARRLQDLGAVGRSEARRRRHYTCDSSLDAPPRCPADWFETTLPAHPPGWPAQPRTRCGQDTRESHGTGPESWREQKRDRSAYHQEAALPA